MTGAFGIFVEAAAGQFDKAMADATQELRVASMESGFRMAEVAKAAARANIAQAGFSRAWQNTVASKVYPLDHASARPSVLIYNKIPYSNIFEEGGGIAGHPLLWLPLKDAPPHIGKQRITPALYIERRGPLFTIERPGKPPLLAARLGTSERGKRGGVKLRTVPMFVGIDAVTLRERFQVREAVEKAAEQWPEIFAQVFNKGG
ncbi:DUF6441 family protein [Mesorhizobium sp. ESP7-2]|uniref:DUF6441 family protein n=1 Tax=Mesorhizobium sp. ESP7-2 TaxID=2876622 RepID=UPI001CCC74E1|nr:DUF6441 family protein [Mesorhizobium sp. ESP7-2]MBZ9705386.1 DUF6441 family protein [Mesorhizobium sp. ESP7-2]